MIATSEMFTATPRARWTEPFRGRTPPPLNPGRQALHPNELVDAINQMLRARPECTGFEFEAGALVPVTPDADGCNWRLQGLRMRVANGPSTRALVGVRQVVELARLSYDLADPSATPEPCYAANGAPGLVLVPGPQDG